jgi:CheY-like chemotaxis protein
MAQGMAEKQTILVIDDEAVIVDAARKILSIEGFAVQTAADAEAALPILQKAAPDIALIDLMLPGLSGMELLHFIKRDFPRTVVIMMTGYSTLENAVGFLKDGAIDFLPKPFAFEELVSTVRRAGRFADWVGSDRTAAWQASAPKLYRLGIASWAMADQDGTVRLGITDLFRRIVGPIAKIELPPLHSELYQGGLLAQVYAEDELRHTVWSALGGRVIAVNSHADEIFRTESADPSGSGWLVRMVPGRLERELVNLSSSHPGAGAKQ